MRQRNSWRTITLILLIAVILTASSNVYLYGRTLESETRYNSLLSEIGKISYEVDFLINFGNGTMSWYNETYVPVGFSLLNLTLKTTGGDTEFTTGQYGVFVNSIGGVGSNSMSKSHAWLWWHFDLYQGKWVLGEMGADQYILSTGDIIAWHYQDTSNYPILKPPS